MSGICGLMRLDGGPAEAIGAMAAPLERRGPDGTRLWADGSVALGQTLLATTPEALVEALPLTHAESGWTITADARLDNREELLAAFGLAGPGRVIGDGELILRAWLAWGEGCLHRLLGDFAFLLWDSRQRRLWAARDPLGMRALAYAHAPGRLLALATEPRAVLAAPGAARGIDWARVADVLDGHLEAIDHETTIFQGVQRLPPGHWLRADAGGVTIRRYWTPTPGPLLRLRGPDDYAEAFREVFTEAVRCRLRAAGPVGSMLSGGMDSGSVVAVASRLLAAEGRGPLPTFSVAGPDPATCAESRALRASLTLPNLDPHVVDLGDLSVWEDDLLAALAGIADPFDGHMNLPRAAYLAARRAGVRVVLDGVAGDVALHCGQRIGHLIRGGRLLAAWREVRGTERFWGGEIPRRTILGDALRQAAPESARALGRRWRGATARRPRSPILSEALAREVDIDARVERDRRNNRLPTGSEAQQRAALLAGPALAIGRERYDHVAGAFGIEPRDPFMDLRVVDFALRCPGEQLMSDGWPKTLLRRAMEGLLPPEVIWRPGRTHLGMDLSGAIVARLGPLSTIRNSLSPDAAELLADWTGLRNGQPLPDTLGEETCLDFVNLVLWLGQPSLGPILQPS
ncbi:asparagine synthase-related protein [Rubellimicrobium aerolatum]|uniref:asparagine synthase (glutamine-hydrolyzing) n=1 Tax=Rubellimicrobium aerolatum TaxID=490979 RepID=A0ABW0S959_9RHOB|nr:asparagine synthase-related protein [Rubellimicrobium aerolatum]MBP1804832.1 asparagine synthase (glutamine-hydrolyzing) [Rubellimicrobium aerolatum]